MIMTLEELQERRKNIEKRMDSSLESMHKIEKETERVRDVACHAGQIIADFDAEFEKETGLDKKDTAFVMFATALQIIRWVLVNKLTEVEKAGQGNQREEKLHDMQNKILSKLKKEENSIEVPERPYYASLTHIIERLGVPYDATQYLTKESIARLLNKGRDWTVDVDLFKTDKLSLFKGANHRFATIGHDPSMLGFVVGVANIMTNTITCVQHEVPVLPTFSTNFVVYTSNFRDPRIGIEASTVQMFVETFKRCVQEPQALVAAMIKQLIHIGTDLYTPCGIQIPGANLVLSNRTTERLTSYISMGDVVKAGKSAMIAELINKMVEIMYGLTYEEANIPEKKLFEVKMKKIIMYANTIATTSNLIWVGANVIWGDKGKIKDFDMGGLLVTIKRLLTDGDFIRQIKEEYVLGNYRKLVMEGNRDGI